MQLLKSPEELRAVLEDAWVKMTTVEGARSLERVIDDLRTMLRLVRASVNRTYTEVSKANLAYIVGAVVYFLVPIDSIPDILGPFGYLDDAAVILWVISLVEEELESFKDWETRHGALALAAVLPRPAWRRTDVARETPDPRASYRSYRSCPVVEDVLTDEDLTALMEAREHDGWPAELAGNVYGMPYWLIRDTGWNALIRAAFTLLLPLQCEGQAQPLRLAAVRVNGLKPRFLSFEGYGFDAYRWGIAALVRIYSQSTCIGCGLLRAGAAHRPERRGICRWAVLGPGS